MVTSLPICLFASCLQHQLFYPNGGEIMKKSLIFVGLMAGLLVCLGGCGEDGSDAELRVSHANCNTAMNGCD